MNVAQGDPGPRMLHVSRLLQGATAGLSSPHLAALAAAAIRTMLFVTVARTHVGTAEEVLSRDASGHPAGSGGTAECWRLSDAHQFQVVPPLEPTAKRLCSLNTDKQLALRQTKKSFAPALAQACTVPKDTTALPGLHHLCHLHMLDHHCLILIIVRLCTVDRVRVPAAAG